MLSASPFLTSDCSCKFTKACVSIAQILCNIFSAPSWLLKLIPPYNLKWFGLIAIMRMPLGGARYICFKLNQGGGYTSSISQPWSICIKEKPLCCFQWQPPVKLAEHRLTEIRVVLMLKFYSIAHDSAIHLSTQALKGLGGCLLDLAKDLKSYISCFA